MESHDFPVDLPPDMNGGEGALRWTASILMFTTVALALLNASAIANWSHELAPSPGTARLMSAADAWQGVAEKAGLDVPHAKLHRVWLKVEAARW